jgi:hypothetical protein
MELKIMLNGIKIIADERKRQIEAEGWDKEHDSQHRAGELADAAACYSRPELVKMIWPWDLKWWKPSEDRIKDLTKAGALIAAEIDRLLELKKKEVYYAGLKSKNKYTRLVAEAFGHEAFGIEPTTENLCQELVFLYKDNYQKEDPIIEQLKYFESMYFITNYIVLHTNYDTMINGHFYQMK